jgi:hypothetical protein
MPAWHSALEQLYLLREKKEQEAGGNCIIRSFIIFALY